MSEYNPFDIAPPVLPAQDEKPPEKPAQTTDAARPPAAEICYAAPPPTAGPRPSDPAAPGRAPLAGQPASMGIPAPAPRYAPPSPPVSSMPPAPYGAAQSPMPQPAYAAATPPPVEPMPDPNVRFDLAGNPLPPTQSMGGGAQAVAPPPSAGAVRYDLAGNPLPVSAAPPAPPAGPYGYAPAPGGPPPPAYQNQEYTPPQNAFRPSAPSGPMIPAGMEEAMTAGANWMIGIVILTMASIWLNKLTYPIFFPFVSYAAITGVINIPWVLGPFMGYTTAGILACVALIPLALLGVLGFKRQAWVFMVAMIIYGIDIPVTILTWIVHLSLWGIILGTAWHSFVFQRMFAAFTAAREINSTMAGLRN